MFVPLTPLDYKRRAVRNFGDKIGVVDEERRFTYREFGERADRLAGALRSLGVAPGDRVAFISYNTHHLLEAYYGVPQAGGVLTPINIRLAPEEIAYVLDHCGATVLCYHRDFKDLVNRVRGGLRSLRHTVIIEGEDPEAHRYETLLARAAPDPGPDILQVDENAVCELFYTSGTTGRPKGVALTHRALALHALHFNVSMRMSDADRVLHVVPLFHVNGWGTPQSLTAVGGTHVMLRRVVAQDILRLIDRERITILLGVPTIYNMLINEPTIGTFDLTSLRRAVSGGAPASQSLIRAMEEKLGCLCLVGYGLTETSPLLAKALPKAHLGGGAEDDLRRRSTTGFEVIGVDMRVVDGQGREVPRDGKSVGEIVTRSNVVMDGYFRDPEATEAVMRGGWFHTGDMAVVDAEGYATIVDRQKDIIVSGGENISSVEIEKALAAHPAVFECSVIAVPDERWGETPKALVVLKPGQRAAAEEIIAHCRSRLAGFKVPSSVEFRDTLPKTGTGKITKHELREPYWRGYEKRVH
ncbi:MAG TPA: fatty acid--CoA ligase [bacterium]|nr:fatty acid--CoA ligase [bacterium]